jgi:hypothetical protein
MTRLPLLCSNALIARSRKFANRQLSIIGATKKRMNKRVTNPFWLKIKTVWPFQTDHSHTAHDSFFRGSVTFR